MELNYLTSDFSTYNDVFQILDYKKLLPLSDKVDYYMLFNEYYLNINSPMDLINYLNERDESILPNICSFLNSIPNNIQTNQSSSMNWYCPGKVIVINGRQRNIKLLGEINQVNNKVKVLFLIANAYCHKNCCDQLIFNRYDLWDKYWGPTSHPLFPEKIECSNINIKNDYDTITIVDNNTYTYGYEHNYLIKIVRTDLEYKYFKSTSYIILKNKESIKLTNLINGTYEISLAVSYTNGINGVNDYVWSEFCTSTTIPLVKLSIPGYLKIDNEVYWEYHCILPADDTNGSGGLPNYFDKYQGKMRNYFLTWWKEIEDSNLDNGSITLGKASLENCSYDLRYTTEIPTEDSIWIYYNDILFKKKSDYKNPNDYLDLQTDFDLNNSNFQKITVLGYQNIWVQMRVRNQIGVPDWPIVNGYTIGTFSWGAPADRMSPVQPLAALPRFFRLNFVFNKPITWWATQYDDNTSDYQKNHKPNINPVFLIFPLINTLGQLYTELDYTSKINRHITTLSKNYSSRPYFIFTNENFIQLTKDEIPQYEHLQLHNNTAHPKKCYYNKLPTPTGFNFVDGRTYKSLAHPCTTVTLENNSNGYYRKSTDPDNKRPYIEETLIAGHAHNLTYEYESEAENGKIFMNFSDIVASESLPESPVYIGMKVINYDDLRITNHRYPYDHTLTAIKIPPFNIEDIGSPSPESPLQIMNTDVQYSIPVPISIETPNVDVIFITYTYTDNPADSNITVTFSNTQGKSLHNVEITVYTICIEGSPAMIPLGPPIAQLVSGPTKSTQYITVDGKIILDNANQDYGTIKSNIFFMECKYLDNDHLIYYTFKNTEHTTFVISNFTLNLSTMSIFHDQLAPGPVDPDYKNLFSGFFTFQYNFCAPLTPSVTYYDYDKIFYQKTLDIYWRLYPLKKYDIPGTSLSGPNYFTKVLKQISINSLDIYNLYIKFLTENILFDMLYLEDIFGNVHNNVAIGIHIGSASFPWDNPVYMSANCPNLPLPGTPPPHGSINSIRQFTCSLYFSTEIFTANNSRVTTSKQIRDIPPLLPPFTEGAQPLPIPP